MKRKKEIPVLAKDPVELKIVRAHVDILPSLMPIFSGGRFSDLKLHIKEEIEEIPADQFVTIRVGKEIASNKKERGSVCSSICFFLKKRNLNWVCRWSASAGGFLLVRREQWDATRRNRKS